MAKKTRNMKLASYLIAKGLLTVEQAQEIMQDQGTQSGAGRELFGRIAVRKGFIKETVLNRVLIERQKESFE